MADLLSHSAGSEFQVAENYAYLGNSDQAFAWLARARVQHDGGLIWLRSDPAFKQWVTDARYTAFLKLMQYPD